MVEASVPRIRGLIEDALEKYGIPGAAAGIVVGSRLEWSDGFGFADLKTRRAPDAGTLFRVASITKTFTGAAIMQLRDAGKLSLDDPVTTHISEFKRVRAKRGSLEQVTLRRLLTHHSGLVTEAPFPYWETLEFPPFDRVLESLGSVEVVLEPDTQFKYSNLAFALLGEVVARVSGRAYPDFVRERLIRPLGLDSTVFELTPGLRRCFATGYDADPHSDVPVEAVHHPLGGLLAAGGLYSSVSDLARWVSFQLGATGSTGDEVLARSTLREMHRPQILEPDWKAGYGLPWRSTRSGDRVYVNHGGGLPGHRTTVHFDPAHGVGFIFLTNLGWHNAPEDVAVPALDAINDALVQRPAAATPPAPPPARYRRLLGAYVARNVLFTNVGWRDGALRLVLPPGVRSMHAPAGLEPTADPLTFEVVGGRGGGEAAVFEADPQGEIVSFALGGAVYHRLRTQPPQAGGPVVREPRDTKSEGSQKRAPTRGKKKRGPE